MVKKNSGFEKLHTLPSSYALLLQIEGMIIAVNIILLKTHQFGHDSLTELVGNVFGRL